MIDGTLRDHKQMITVEVYIGDVSFNLELLVLGQSADHLTLGIGFLAKAGTAITMGNTTVNITKHSEAQGPMSTHRSEQPSQPKNSKLTSQATIDNAERADVENMVRFDQPAPVKPKRGFRVRHSNIMERSPQPKRPQAHTVNPKLITASATKVTTLSHAESSKMTKANRIETTDPKSKTGNIATISTTGLEHVSNNTKKATIDRGPDAPIGAKGASSTMGKALERPAEVTNPRTMPLTASNITATAATTSPHISRPKYSTPGKVINATVRSARVFKKVQNITMCGDTSITVTASRKTSKNAKDKEYQNYKGKVANTFYVTASNTEHTSSA
uniref:Uncharacterized protein n=1 Tax=Glossina austeni TaxID=7395 RepID=A0A1A9VP66_GLOAU